MTRMIMLLALISGCSKPATGSERGECYGNNTCNAGLICLSNVCVKDDGDLAVANDLSFASDLSTLGDMTSLPDLRLQDAARYDDAGLACPGANIFHPGTESRVVNTSVPFVGRARDANCMSITGSSLVWTDNLEGQIGTGETFNHTFTMVGSHTVTLTATDGANMYPATVSFMITN